VGVAFISSGLSGNIVVLDFLPFLRWHLLLFILFSVVIFWAIFFLSNGIFFQISDISIPLCTSSYQNYNITFRTQLHPHGMISRLSYFTTIGDIIVFCKFDNIFRDHHNSNSIIFRLCNFTSIFHAIVYCNFDNIFWTQHYYFTTISDAMGYSKFDIIFKPSISPVVLVSVHQTSKLYPTLSVIVSLTRSFEPSSPPTASFSDDPT